MTPATVKIKIKLFENGDSLAGLAGQWGFTRALLTKVAHGERGNGPEAKRAKKKLARYMGMKLEDLFGQDSTVSKAA